MTLTPVAAVPPKLTAAPATKFAPVTVTAVPPPVGPLLGDTLLTVGAGAAEAYVKPFARVALCASGLVTTTLTVPAACAGVVAAMRVLLATVTPVAAAPPKRTVTP